MTDRQIMIHGVDVNRCMFFNEEYNEDDVKIKNFCEWQFVPCQEFDCAKCYFKNWKRKEEECEYWKHQAELGVDTTNRLTKELKETEEECEELKEKLSRKKAVIDFASCPSYGYRDNDIEPTCTKTFCYDIESCEYKTMIKYEQTLTEIQDEARDGYCSGTQTGCEKSLQQILQKCEVLDE